MSDSPHAVLLDKVGPPEDAERHFRPQIDLITDLAAYGSHLIVRCYRPSGRQLRELVLLGVFAKQVVAMLDSCEVLLRQGCSPAVTVQLRALLEASLYVDWVLREETEARVAAYYVWNLRRLRRWARKAIPGTPEFAEFIATRERLHGHPLEVAVGEPGEASAALRAIQETLDSTEFRPIEEALDHARGKRRTDPPWYVVCGARSLRQIAAQVDRLHEYDYMYAPASDALHASTLGAHLRLDEGAVSFLGVRSMAEFPTQFAFMFGAGFLTFRSLLGFYRPEELPNFHRKYREEWRTGFRSLPSVAVHFGTALFDP